MDNEIEDALRRKAIGYSKDEQKIVKEKNDNGEWVEKRLIVIERHYPPSDKALKALLARGGKSKNKYDTMTVEELKEERRKLIEKLAREREGKKK